MKKLKLSLFVAAIAVGAASPAFAEDKKEFITIGTGGVTGVYYPTGGAICHSVNKGRKEHGIRCSVESTGGSIYNINTIRSGELDMGVAQSDWQFHAYNGTSKFKEEGPFKALRAVFSVHPEPFTVLARADAGIREFKDLKGKRVNIGNPGSGQRGTMEVLMDKMGWKKDDFALASELKSSEQSSALCDNKVDAIVFTVGHPSGSIKEATTSCDTVLVNVGGEKDENGECKDKADKECKVINNLIKNNAYYRTATIPGGMYKGNEDTITTFGVGATIVSSTQTSEKAVYEVVKAVFENIDDFKRLHPAFAHLKRSEMISDGLSAPLHDGAKKYYVEAGLLKK